MCACARSCEWDAQCQNSIQNVCRVAIQSINHHLIVFVCVRVPVRAPCAAKHPEGYKLTFVPCSLPSTASNCIIFVNTHSNQPTNTILHRIQRGTTNTSSTLRHQHIQRSTYAATVSIVWKRKHHFSISQRLAAIQIFYEYIIRVPATSHHNFSTQKDKPIIIVAAVTVDSASIRVSHPFGTEATMRSNRLLFIC